jgi:molybdopterin synthase catalytic subunit
MATKQLRLLYFAALRERAGLKHETVTVDPAEVATLSALWQTVTDRHPSLAGLREQLRVAVDRQMVDWQHDVTDIDDGADIAFIPPVSGGSGADTTDDGPPETRLDGAIAVTPVELKPPQIEAYVRRASAGGLVTFEGIVRNHTDGRPVDHLVYEAYTPMAADVLAEIHDRATTRWPEVDIAIHHRIGTLEVGETAVVVAAASAHRTASFEAVQWAIRVLKQEAPIWKKEVGPDGEAWKGGAG